MANRIGDEWELFKRAVMPADAPAVQVSEMRKAFYAGATALVGVLMRSLKSGVEPTDADLVMMDEIADELNQFQRRVAAGAA